MIEIQIQEGVPESFDPGDMEDFIRKVLALAEVSPDSDLSLVFTTDEEIQRLNREYLEIDAPTDVLSFTMNFDNPETGATYLGDIVISVPSAARQAETGGHPLIEEIKLLVVHGVLHLLGHDHGEPGDKAAMWQTQEDILNALDIQARPTET